MKKHFQTLILTLIAGLPVMQLQARHLDGEWPNNQRSIALHHQSTQRADSAKQPYKGIWDKHERKGNRSSAGQPGNYGKHQVENKHKRFDTDNSAGRPSAWKNNRQEAGRSSNLHHERKWSKLKANRGQYNAYRVNRVNQDRLSLNGRWFEPNGRRPVQIETKHQALRIRKSGGRWMKFERINKNALYKNRRGDTIRVLNPHTLQWRNNQKKSTMYLYR